MSDYTSRSDGMPNSMGPIGQLLKKQAIITAAIVDRVFQLSGRPYVDCRDPFTGQIWKGVPVVVLGGTEERFGYWPVGFNKDTVQQFDAGVNSQYATTSAQVLLLHRKAQNSIPWCIGTVGHRKMDLKDKAPEVEQTADHPGDIGIQDFGWRNGTAKFIVDENGEITFLTEANIRLQLDGNGVVRLSRDGSAAERLILAGPLVDKLADVVQFQLDTQEYLDQLPARLQIWIALATVNIITGVVTAPPNPIASFTATAPTLTATEKNKLKAAAIHISSDDES